ncbi:enoyl-CoA hydratase/isomerase family protein [Flagellimonas halotolerans]|uniref:Enoyl-CoA hydratase/isomerase family protein n=1 Tax=Flagellimonas halotolerans TaxID=3112164 RepID=A0ABU6IKW1_9FLAO|nr:MULTISPECIES: enoyl-CoA hydratase/isomerase family protein [unclassified Allomuricauda]MEC3963855.1 enoyl-CoA hydratase/isomerase family protein [Muricauda sp. SYSU M86414]MEC4263725.1 enoyl-CoA hydratase/isomerase family protein [Muricauda sp. SYSU M84420]
MTTDRTNGSLYTKIENRIATVEFGHPASNSFVSELLARLAKEFDKLGENDEVSVIVLKSEGERAFCAGASFDELVAVSNLEEGKEFFSGFANVINAMRKCPKPIIGRVQGKTVGGGVGLASACDYVHATVEAAIKLSEISIGIGPFVIAPAVERKMGKAALAELTLYPSEWKNAYWAKEQGLYSKVYDSISEMDKELDIHLQKLATYNPEALAEMKKVLWEGTEHWDQLLLERAEASGRLALSPNTKKALEKFKK